MMYSMSFIVLTVGVWLRITIFINTAKNANIKFATLHKDTYPLYCQANHQTDTMLFTPDMKNDKVPTFFLPAETEYWSKKVCLEMHIIGNQLDPEKGIPAYRLVSCTAKYMSVDDIANLQEMSMNLANNLTAMKDLVTFSLDNSVGRVTCTGDDRYFDLMGSDINFQAGHNQTFTTVSISKGKSNGKVVVHSQLTWSDAPVFTLKEVKCTLCLRRKSDGKNGGSKLAGLDYRVLAGLLIGSFTVFYAVAFREVV